MANCGLSSMAARLTWWSRTVTCPATEGHHVVTGAKPFGLSVYGYYNVGSYAFVGGSDVKIINPIL